MFCLVIYIKLIYKSVCQKYVSFTSNENIKLPKMYNILYLSIYRCKIVFRNKDDLFFVGISFYYFLSCSINLNDMNIRKCLLSKKKSDKIKPRVVISSAEFNLNSLIMQSAAHHPSYNSLEGNKNKIKERQKKAVDAPMGPVLPKNRSRTYYSTFILEVDLIIGSSTCENSQE